MAPLDFLRGVAAGFVLAAPIGPVGILCIRKALADGRFAAFIAGLGAAVADTVYGATAGLGLGAISSVLDGRLPVLQGVGGAFMVGLGLRTWRNGAFAVGEPGAKGQGLWRDFLSTFLITITNPGTVLGAMGVFAAFGAAPSAAEDAFVPMVAGVFAGSALWWLVLAMVTAALRSRFTPPRMRVFNHLSGGMLVAFGVLALASLGLPLMK